MTRIVCASLGLSLSIDDKVVTKLLRFRQKSRRNEAGGLLFGEVINERNIRIIELSTPSIWDRRSYQSFQIHEKNAQKIIKKKFSRGLHYLGDWHSHPQHRPMPSTTDKYTLNKIFQESDHQLNYLLMLIIGSSSEFSNSYVAFTDGNNYFDCRINK